MIKLVTFFAWSASSDVESVMDDVSVAGPAVVDVPDGSGVEIFHVFVLESF